MGENAAALHTAVNAVQALGRGFDVNFDTRLLYCKGVAGSRVVQIDDEHSRDLRMSDLLMVPDVSRDINVSYPSQGRQQSGIYTFDEMVEYFNKKASLSGSPPLGSFNAAFSLTGSKSIDVAATKTLSMDGFYIPLAKVELTRTNLVLQENVKRAVPTFWDPPSLASFIENFGTHVITSITIGGKDVIYVKQHQSSPLSAMEIKSYVQEIGNQRFCEAEVHATPGQKLKDKGVDPHLFNSQGVYPQPGAPYLTGKEDVTVIFRRRGGDDLEQNHDQWARTVQSSPDIIEMTFSPISSLLDGITGKEHLTRAINLYLEYKPQIEELRYFLEFQIPRVWAPLQENIPGHPRKEPVCPSLQFSMMGQKLYVSQEQISVGRKPVTGLRLRLEGIKHNRLCIHLQHLASLPKILQPYWDSHVAIGAPKWVGPEEQDSRWFEPVKWKNFSHVSTAPVENPETFIGDLSGVFIVTGAQLGVWDFGSRNVLYMKLLYSRLPGCTIRRSLWDHCPADNYSKTRKTAATGNSPGSGSGDSSSASNEGTTANKLAKFVDMSEMFKGPQDPPGHWLVTGGKLGVEKGKIILRVKYSLLNY
ncbi:MACPF domain-containing protein CAD1-like [Punica granatum]|uniref:MACPF domain-containing protein CAD1-like n=1 Tax=Punica granatum TaxID=22663 RepID=A0A6P8E7X9_PUNGR|nr:MACPF domain-containing protein CAD1-like [Punica granatum]